MSVPSLPLVQQSRRFAVREATTDTMRRAAFALRYDIFVRELGGDGPAVDHAAGLERDRHDATATQLLLFDRAAGDRVVGAYRMMSAAQAGATVGFYTEAEYDLTALRRSGRRLMEFGRSCVLPEYRGGPAMAVMWGHILARVRAEGAGVLFGVASFHGTQTKTLAAPLSILHHNHRVAEAIRPIARPPGAVAMDVVPAESLDRKAAMREVPALIKAYLRLGAGVGEGAWRDAAFNTTDICIVLDMERLNPVQARLYERAVS